MRALIIVDVQNAFCPGGALQVPKGDEVIAIANAMKKEFRSRGDIVIATQDWHPANHKSFAASHVGKNVYDNILLGGLPQCLWPVHCVQDTYGANFHKDLDLHAVTIFRKGTDPEVDSYSGFYDNGHKRGTGLTSYLVNLSIREVHVVGLATDYCVKFTCLDAVNDGFDTTVYEAGCRAVDLHVGDGKKAFDEMRDAGVLIV